MNLELVYPMAAMVLLTFAVTVKLFRTRIRSVKAGEVTAAFYKTYQEGSEPRENAQLSRQLVNLFETPVLFYAACIVGLISGQGGVVFLALAWLYVALRVGHAVIHTGRNKLSSRIKVYAASWLVLLYMWGTLVFEAATR